MENAVDNAVDNAYDLLPYPSFSYAHTHPDHLATLAHLMGVATAPVATCRVLELGCASGGNLIPMAYSAPEAHFVGIDVSARQIAQGQANAEALGVSNVTLHAMDILDDTDALGTFDYIVAHGVYSWVPAPVRDKVLHICAHNLAPHGVAYVSYNTYPGWGVLGAIREMMLYRTRELTDPAERAAEARAVLKFLETAVPEQNPYGDFVRWYATFIQDELKKLGAHADAYFLHDELEEINQPFYFHEFAAHIAEHGLQYMAEASFRDMFPHDLTPQAREQLQTMAQGLVEREQYMDMLRNKLFRQSLICHGDLGLRRALEPEDVRALYVASPASAASEAPDVHAKSVEQFRTPKGVTLSTDHPVTKAAMLALFEAWPRALAFDELLTAARERLGDTSPLNWEQDAHVLSTNLLQAFCYSKQLVALHTYVPAMAASVSQRPVASPVARFQARDTAFVSSLWHDRVFLNDIDRYVLGALDGSRTRDDVLADLLRQATEGQVTVEQDGQPVEDLEALREVLEPRLDQHLHSLVEAALLVG